MAGNDIKQKIVLEGEKQYRDAIKDAQRNLKTLRSELKAETAELGRNATEQEKAQKKVESLKKQITEQEKIVKANKDALEEVRQKYADNADAIAKYEQKLNDSRTALANMKNELDGVGQGFKKVEADAGMATVATKSVADSLEKLSGIGDAISSGIENAFTGMLDTIKGAVSEVWQLIAETAAKANNWTDLAGFYGTTAEGIQEMERAINGMGAGKFDSFINMMNRLAWGGKEKKITELLGVSDVNYEDKMQYAMAVMEAMQKFQQGHTKDQYDNMMTEIFGAKKSADVTWLLNNWDAILEKKEEYKDKGYLLDADEVENMNQVQLDLFDIEQKWDMLKGKFASGFGNVTLDITTHVSGALDALAKYFDAESPEEREEALEEFHSELLGAFEAMAAAIREGIAILEQVSAELKESEDPIVSGIGTILGGLVSALKWLTEDNMKNVVSALEILAAFWLTGKGASMAAKIASTVANIKLIRGFSAASGAASGAGTAAASGAGTAATSGIFGGGLWASIKSAGAAAGPWAAVAALTGAAWFGLGEAARNRDWGEFEENERKNAERGDLPPILQEIAKAAVGTDEFDEDYDWQQLFRDNVDALQKLTPDSDLWGKISQWVDTSDGLQQEEIDDILSHMMEYGVFSEDFNEMFKDAYNKLSENDIPAEWWRSQGGNSGNTDGLTSGDAKSITESVGRIGTEVRKGMIGIKVVMDRTTVGQLVADEVSRQIAAQITGG